MLQRSQVIVFESGIAYSEQPGACWWSKLPEEEANLSKGQRKEPFEDFVTADRVRPSSKLFTPVTRSRG